MVVVLEKGVDNVPREVVWWALGMYYKVNEWLVHVITKLKCSLNTATLNSSVNED